MLTTHWADVRGVKMATKRCTIHYRKLNREDNQFPALTFSKALARALEFTHPEGKRISENWRLRMAPVPNNPDHFRFLNDSHDDGEGVFGNICLFSPGQLQALIEEHPDASVLDIAEKRAPDGTDYLHAICYWLAIRDHFFIVQHISLQSKAMEEYFTWLLRDQASIIDGNHNVRLQAVFDRNLVGGDLGDIRTVEVGGLIPDTVHPEPVTGDAGGRVIEYEARETLGEKAIRTFAKGKEILETAIGSMETQRLIENMPEEAALEVNVGFGYRAKKRKFSREFMASLETSLRNMPDGEVRVISVTGKIVGDDARLQTVMPIKLVRKDSSLLDNEDASKQLKEVYRRFIEDGRITG